MKSTSKPNPPQPVHIPGTVKGEETVLHRGREPGRGEGKQYRSPRDSTGIRAGDRQPIDPRMPSIPPA